MVDYQRIDLGPNRWMAAGGQAFLYVNAQRRSVAVILAPVRDVIFERSVFCENPRRTAAGTALVIAGFLAIALLSPTGPLAGLLPLAGIAALQVPAAIQRYLRRGQFMLEYSLGAFGGTSGIPFTRAESDRPEFGEFVQHVESCSKAASKKPRKAHRFFLYSWAEIAVYISAMIAVLAGVAFWLPDTAGPVRGFLYSLAAVGVGLVLFQQLHLIVSGDLRSAHALLREKELDAATAILERFIERKPDHAYARELLTIAELMRCDMDVAESLIVQGDEFDPWRRSWLMRALYYKHWESRHDEH
ncbi:MAG: hypothetical protein IT365_17290 [Candidatus Hydrogenedentes bacterium]|nr:hypothetical protein [Candidatus Hydrogenedentota bacterium]